MKKKNTLLKWAAAAAAVAGIAYLVVRYFDTIHAWLCKLCPCCTLEDDFVVDEPYTPVTYEAHEEESATEEPTEKVETEEVPVEEDGAPVADESDFESDSEEE